MVVFDTTTLLLLLAPDASVPKDSNGTPISFAKERIDGLVVDLSKRKVKIIIPTPALSEALVRAGSVAGANYLARIRKSGWFRIESFDERAAIEVAEMTKGAIDRGDKKDGSDATWTKVKYDRQIVAIAKVNSAPAIYSDDINLTSFARRNGLRVISVADLNVPNEASQMDWVNQANEQASQEPDPK
ncbi:type II toxin-antitoxin system VapC family toxin [Mesorhizobium sp. B2-3-3]|nr:type II toxin-antitoxin system VapC family toxin [Mesorhizobium sp. B2-3-3]